MFSGDHRFSEHASPAELFEVSEMRSSRYEISNTHFHFRTGLQRPPAHRVSPGAFS